MIIGLIPALTIPHANAQDECTDEPMCVFLHPGLGDSYKPAWSHTLGTLWGTDGGDDQTRQVFDNYLDYAIIANSVGDLQFDITVTAEEGIGYLDIYVPPEFQWLGPSKEESIWTDITNDYMFIWTMTMNAYDQVAPGWTRVNIGMDTNFANSLQIQSTFSTLEINPGIYHIRFFNLQAPERAGLYHFKIYYGPVGVPFAGLPDQATSLGAVNYPFTIVKTELNPAYGQVLVRTHAYTGPDTICYPPSGPAPCPLLSGWVHAEGTTPEGRTVEAVGYWGPYDFLGSSTKPGEAGGLYQVWMFGLAAGTYTFTAEATGFGQGSAERVVVEAGQSMHVVFIVVYNSPAVSVTIYSKHGTGEIPWHNLWQLPFGTNNPVALPDNDGPWRDMMLELYDADNNLIGFWASNLYTLKWMGHTNKLLGMHDDGDSSGCVAPATGPPPDTPFTDPRGLTCHGGVEPESTTYHAVLTDNWDLLGNLRGPSNILPGTHWDGHVPWDSADYIAGMPPGQYTVEAYVTGYIMDEPDAYQRTFTLGGINIAVAFDLRRSNWIETSMHLPSGVFLQFDTTVRLAAEDADGNERGATAFTATPEMIADPDDYNLDGTDALFAAASTPNWEYYDGGIIIEGWNGVFPNTGSSFPRGDSQARDPAKKDYGLNPTAATHSAGAVSLAGNPYSIKLYMADMGVPWLGIPGSGWYNIVGEQQVSVFLCNSPASLSFLILNAWLQITLRSVDFQVPAHSRPWTFPGSEIWVEFKDEEGNPVATNPVLDPTLYGLLQDPDGVTPFDIDIENDDGQHELLRVNYYGSDWCNLENTFYGRPLIRAVSGNSKSWFLPAGQVSFDVHTHGYIMRRAFPVQIPFSGGGNIQADLIQAGQIRVLMEFRHEGEATPFNGFVRVEVFNEAGDLVGANVYGQAEANHYTQSGFGGAYLPYQFWADDMVVPGPAAATGFGEGYASSTLEFWPNWAEQRAYTSSILYDVPAQLAPYIPGTWATWSMTTPADANRISQGPDGAGLLEYFDVYGFYWYYGGPARTWAGGWPTVNTWGAASNPWTGSQWDTGLRGTVDIPNWSGSGGGTYTVKVWAFDARGPDNAYGTDVNPADDWRMYSMAWELSGVEVPWGGAQELFMTMNNMASLRGTVRWFDMFGNLRSLPWAQITASPGPTTDTVPAYSSGYGAVGAGPSDPAGAYIMWLPAGSHDLSITTSEAPQVWSSSAPTSNMDYTAVVSDGWVGGADTQLEQSGVPVPELPSFVAPLALFAALAASVWLLRKRTLNAPVLMK